jgi:tetratricopeptide (TPR) repeat protein
MLTPLLLLLISTSARADDWGSWGEAKGFYEAGNLEEALHSLRSHPAENGAYFYNLGTVHYRLAQYGLAVAYLEKASRLRPSDPDLQHNLDLARAGLARMIGKDRLDPASSWLERSAGQFPLREISGGLGLVALLLALMMLRTYHRTGHVLRSVLSPAGILAILAFATATGVSVAQRVAVRNPTAAAVEGVAVRSGPGQSYVELGRVEAGTQVRLLGQVAQGEQNALWRQVRYSATAVGWVPASSLLLL